MTTRHPSFRHVRFTRRSRERHAQADMAARQTYPLPVPKTAAKPSAKGQDALPLAGFYRLYEAQLRAERKSAKTIRIYNEVLGKLKNWFERTYGRPAVLADLNLIEVRLFLAAALETRKWEGHPLLEGTTKETLAGLTVHQYTRGLKTFGAWLERERYAPAYPLQNLRLPKLDEKQLQPLTEEEERALLGCYDDNKPLECRVKAIFLLLLDTDLRLGELLGLKLDNLDLDGGFLLVMGKGRKERSIPFGFTTERLLRKYVTFFRPDPALPSIGELFLSPDGYPMTYNAVKMLFKLAAQRSGIARLHPHLLRHTFGIRAYRSEQRQFRRPDKDRTVGPLAGQSRHIHQPFFRREVIWPQRGFGVCLHLPHACEQALQGVVARLHLLGETARQREEQVFALVAVRSEPFLDELALDCKGGLELPRYESERLGLQRAPVGEVDDSHRQALSDPPGAAAGLTHRVFALAHAAASFVRRATRQCRR